MKKKPALPGALKVRQDPWHESPCSRCTGSPCCGSLPLAPLRLESRNDFVNLVLASCYNGIFPALKKSGEWTIYLGRGCRFLDENEGKCAIHDTPGQSMVCKSYDAHACWYVDAFAADRFRTMIPFHTDMLIWYEKRFGLIANRFDADVDWESLCREAYEYRRGTLNFDSSIDLEHGGPRRLSFRKSRSDRYLFFPPYNRPENGNHFELISFRLGFPGVSLAVSDTYWSFLIRTELNASRLDLFRREYFPAVGHRDGAFSFDGMAGANRPFSEAGDQWVVLELADLELLKALTSFDSSDKVKRLPSSAVLLDALKRRTPDRAA